MSKRSTRSPDSRSYRSAAPFGSIAHRPASSDERSQHNSSVRNVPVTSAERPSTRVNDDPPAMAYAATQISSPTPSAVAAPSSTSTVALTWLVAGSTATSELVSNDTPHTCSESAAKPSASPPLMSIDASTAIAARGTEVDGTGATDVEVLTEFGGSDE